MGVIVTGTLEKRRNSTHKVRESHNHKQGVAIPGTSRRGVNMPGIPEKGCNHTQTTEKGRKGAAAVECSFFKLNQILNNLRII